MSNPILSWRRVRALCVKETRQIVRDPSSWRQHWPLRQPLTHRTV